MNNKKLFAAIVMLFCMLLVSESCVQGFTLSGNSLSNAGESASKWMKSNIFLWYTTDTTGTLKPEYTTQRKVVDFILFFVMFFSLALLGLKKAFGEGGGNAVTALAFSIGFMLALALVAFSQVTLALFFPFAKNIIFLVMVWIIFAIAKKIFGDKHTFWLFLLALVLGWLAFNYIGPGVGISDMSLQRKDYSGEITDMQNKLIALKSKAGRSIQEERDILALNKKLSDMYVSQGRSSLEIRDYDAAEKNFEKALEYDYNNNEARSWLTNGLFNRMLKENIELLRVSKIILESMNKRYKETKDPAEKEDLCKKMAEMLDVVSKTKEELKESVNNRLEDVEIRRKMLGIIECEKNYECAKYVGKEGYICLDTKCVPCTQRATLCGEKVCNTATGKCEPRPS